MCSSDLLQSPSVAPTAWPVFHSRTYRRNRSEERVPPTKQGYAGVSWASPWDCWLAATIGRIEFVILRTSRSPPDALHLPSRGRSFDRLRQPGRPPTGTRTLLVQYTCNRTAPGGSRGTRPLSPGASLDGGFGLPVPWSRRMLPSAARMAKRRQHRASEGQDANPVRHGICAPPTAYFKQAAGSCAQIGRAHV